MVNDLNEKIYQSHRTILPNFIPNIEDHQSETSVYTYNSPAQCTSNGLFTPPASAILNHLQHGGDDKVMIIDYRQESK